jgi:hypothetical protein
MTTLVSVAASFWGKAVVVSTPLFLGVKTMTIKQASWRLGDLRELSASIRTREEVKK